MKTTTIILLFIASTAMAGPPKLDSSELLDQHQFAEAAQHVDNPEINCVCSTNWSPETNMVQIKTPQDLPADTLKEICHGYEGKYFPITESRRRTNIRRVAALLVCEPQINQIGYAPANNSNTLMAVQLGAQVEQMKKQLAEAKAEQKQLASSIDSNIRSLGSRVMDNRDSIISGLQENNRKLSSSVEMLQQDIRKLRSASTPARRFGNTTNSGSSSGGNYSGGSSSRTPPKNIGEGPGGTP